MLIPSIDLKDGAVVQLIQGERLAIKDEDVFKWVRRFERFPKVQVIDLDAAMGAGDNLMLVRQIAGSLSCRVGGRIRTIARAHDVLASGPWSRTAASCSTRTSTTKVGCAARISPRFWPYTVRPRAASPRPAASQPSRKSTNSTPMGWTPLSGWRCTRGNSRFPGFPSA